ncbi:MAG: nucleotide exchange factor GrpE [Tenericutes bacterium GWC2_34_14]|nr:MAG: nucleotide exchange factor GrpE [Tenericutes bacterium GWA2_35_7]OHE28633.1 MAG: nucleotide exchange factor GrpE [Tenericutes bacterium GWC2_34_14]OHE33459.1 MAG: nucleotide exchange factor GrpE [Tenericutes bacterium GWE2_34_108]OHE36744.1 MAG: nucleotide exchange factor GrpE [Tenericutes bacterium GWF1_35_14]OHE38176.1 MAG: nucleotide exchange factor GrpE [Tenericutes bacterium GWF2_35_184]OHE43306.1 MAG: nucleotide exchange factor GrpE [Tenericutes bacterium RIFOXYA2_FULL_36_32]OHE
MDETKDKSLETEEMHEEHETSKKERRNKHKEQVDALENEIKDLKDKMLRNAAELENFKKRMHQERIQDRKYASKSLINDILNPLDQLDRIVNMTTDNDLLKNFLIGFKMINDQLFNVLQADGMKEIEAKGKPFDPNVHHAIEKIEDRNQANGIVLEVIQKGYTYKEQLLRPAMVKVNEWSEENGKDK